MLLYFLNLFGVAAFSVNRALAAGRLALDFPGVVVLASLTAIGGGTLCDAHEPASGVLDGQPHLPDGDRLRGAGYGAVCTVFTDSGTGTAGRRCTGTAGVCPDRRSAGRGRAAAPADPGADGLITGVAGGVMRDICSNQAPLLLRQDIYATAAIAGIALNLALKAIGFKPLRGSGLAWRQ